MIDIHSHVLPGVDDGAPTAAVSLEMLARAGAEGIRAAVLTPHVRPEDGEERDALHRARFAELQSAAAGLPVVLHLGAEVAFRFNLAAVAAWPSVGLAGTRFVLVDLPPGPLSPSLEQGLFELRTAGYRPILAHPERQRELARQAELVARLRQQEVLVQVDAGSLTGQFGRRARAAALDWLGRGWVDYVASDGHDLVRRPMSLLAARRQVEAAVGAEEARWLLEGNPGRLLEGAEPHRREPSPARPARGWRRLFGWLP
ncbi:MAG: CpsB/CapC family capsule biosynthesis tyrosine phosphatase [Gemmatimonadota bacterium]